MHLPPHLDLDEFCADVDALKEELREGVGASDLIHLRKMIGWGRMASCLGYLLIWFPNPLSMFFLSLGSVVRWAMVAHHVLHRGYDRVPEVPHHLTSKGFAKGLRRIIDWNDWLDPAAWAHEHNTLHHYKLGEVHDPDQPQEVLSFLRTSKLPLPLRFSFLLLAAMTWRFFYYAPNTAATLYAHEGRRDPKRPKSYDLFDWRVWLPFTQPGIRVWTRSWLPYITIRFGLTPLPLLALGKNYYLAALINLIGAELLSNLHSFLIIVPNHAGSDLYRFDTSTTKREHFYLRQIIGSTNYNTGGNFNDFLHGWLNYQIEHHVFPDMTMLQYAKAQPKLQALCLKHGIPYVQESVWVRLRKLMEVGLGTEDMPIFNSETQLLQPPLSDKDRSALV